MKAVVSVTIDDEFVVHDIKVIEGEKGLFIGACASYLFTVLYSPVILLLQLLPVPHP